MKKYRIAVAGCGHMARKFWVGYALERKDVEIAALVDINRNNAEKIKEEFNLKCGIYTDIRKQLKSQRQTLFLI